MGGACSAYEGEERLIQGFGGGKLMDLQGVGFGGVDRNELAQDL